MGLSQKGSKKGGDKMAKVNASAILPKARGMYAKRLSKEQYQDLMRKHTVLEVGAILKKHPYFQKSLSSLSITDPHRQQMEDLLEDDIFEKYETLARYDYNPNSFTDYFICYCEVQEILTVLRMISVGILQDTIKPFPPYLIGKLCYDVFGLVNAKDFSQVMAVLKRTPYYRVLYPFWMQDPSLKNYPLIEAALVKYYYSRVFILAKQNLNAQETKQVLGLFFQEAEAYNINIILRIQKYFPDVYTTEEIMSFLVPYHHRVSPEKLKNALGKGNDDALLSVCRQSLGDSTLQMRDLNSFYIRSKKKIQRYAEQLLHLTTSPSMAVASFIFLAQIEKDNVVNIIEGVRYGLSQEQIEKLMQ